MDRILTIISEYNPFHLGHLYQLEESIKKVSPKYKVCIMSGNFIQRGEPSIINKWARTKMALEAGFDMVIELPTIYAISSAENYANGAIKISKKINTSYLSFGSEIGNIKLLEELNNNISKNEEKYYSIIRDSISKGYSYPKAQEIAIEKLFGKSKASLCTPNNILGLEYIKSIISLNSNIIPITIKRNSKFKSASDIRELIINGKSYKKYLPEFSYNNLDNNIIGSLKPFEKIIFYKLRTMTLKQISDVPDIPDNLTTKLKSSSEKCNTLEELLALVKNKSITAARIKRILLYILLDIKEKDIIDSKSIAPYIRVLGIRKESKDLLSKISKNKNVITSIKDFEVSCKNKKLLNMLNIDKRATDIYTLAYKDNSKANLDYTNKLIVL